MTSGNATLDTGVGVSIYGKAGLMMSSKRILMRALRDDVVSGDGKVKIMGLINVETL